MSVIEHVIVREFTYPARNMRLEETAPGWVGTYSFESGSTALLRSFIVRIEAHGGLAGEFVPYMGATASAYAEVVKLAPRLLGLDAFAREGIALNLRINARSGDGSGIGPLDIALWDLAGKATGQPISRMLGAYRSRLPAYVSTWRGDHRGGLDSVAAYCNFAEKCADTGILGFKVHTWLNVSIEKEVELVKTLGQRVGKKIKLMLDPACTYTTFDQGLKVGRACDEAGLLWLEDPFVETGRSTTAHKRLRERIRTPLVQGERIRSLEAKADLIVNGGTDALRADPELDGGITALMKAAHVAEALGTDIQVANGSPAQRHCVAAIRNTGFYEISCVGPDCPNATPPIYLCGYDDQIESIGDDGCVSVPDGPGLGVTYDWEFIEKNTIAVHDFRRGERIAVYPFVQ
jgi:L-alanine-DL-glutamate epimerase-like enolase superfamily enzyme